MRSRSNARSRPPPGPGSVARTGSKKPPVTSGSRGRALGSSGGRSGPKMLQAPVDFASLGSAAVMGAVKVGAGPAWSGMPRQAVLTALLSDGGRGSLQTAQDAGGAGVVPPTSTASKS